MVFASSNVDKEDAPTNWQVAYMAPEAIGQGRIYRRDLAGTAMIYRYMSLDRLLEMLDKKTLTLVSPRKWHDPYEDWWCDQVFAPGSKLATARAFGSCWTTNYRDEPFWRLYACRCDDRPEPLPAVRITTTISRVIQALTWTQDIEISKVFVGKVRYPKRASHLTNLAMRLRDGLDQHVARVAANALFTKRVAYQFESEVRILWIDRQGERDCHHVRIDPLSFIQDIRIGPTKNEKDVTYIRGKLQNRGFPSSQIRESRLYKRPPPLGPLHG